MSSKMKELSKKLVKSDVIPNDTDLLNFFNEFLAWLNTGFNKSRPLPKSQVNKYITMSIPLLLKIDPCAFVNLIPIVLKILAILVHPQTDKDIRETVWRLSISLIDSKTKYMTPNSWNQLIDSAFSKKERDPNFNSGTPSSYSYESNCNLLIIYFNIITTMCNNPNLAQDFIEIKKKVIYHWELISELIFVHIFNVTSDNRKTLDQLCYLILQCINNCQKKFKFVFFTTEIGGPQMINYLLDILLRIEKLSSGNPPNDNSFRLLYKFCKLTFPCQIFTNDQKSIPCECNKNRQIAERITPNINKNYLFVSKSNNSSNSNINSNSPNSRSASSKPKFTINPLLLSCFGAIPSDEVIALLKNMSQNCKNFSPILINSIYIMINLIYPLLVKIQSKVTYINSNFINSSNNDSGNDNGNSNNNGTDNLKTFDRAYLNFTNSDANKAVITYVSQLFSHCIRLRTLLQVVLKSSIDSRTFSAIVQLFFNIQKEEMYPFFVTVFFSILYDRRYIDMKEERDYILLLMSFKFKMAYMPNLFARIASQISVALSTFIINIPENSSREIQPNAILFEEKEIINESLVQIGKVSTDSLYFYFPFTTNDFTTQAAKDFLINMIHSFDPVFNNYISMAAVGAILAVIEWFKEKEKETAKEKLQQQIQQQQFLERSLRLNLKNKRNRPKSHDFQSMKFSEIPVHTDLKKLSSSSLILPTVIDDAAPQTNTNPNLEVIGNDKNSQKAEDASVLLDSSPSVSQNETILNHSSTTTTTTNNNNNLNNEDDKNNNLIYENPFYIDNVSYLKDLDLSFLFGYLLPYLMKSLVKTLDRNASKESQNEINKQLNWFVSWFEEEISSQNQESETYNQESKQKRIQNLKNQSKQKMQIICFNLIFKSIKLAHECNLLTEKLARDWCKLLIMYINSSTKVSKEVNFAIIECVLNSYPLSFSLIPVLSQSFCKIDFASFQDHEKLKIITYLVSVCSMIKKTIQKSKISFLTKSTESKEKANSTDSSSNCAFIDVRADTFAVLTHAFEGLEGVSENIDAASFSLFVDDLYSSEETMFNLTETLIFSRLAHFEKKPSLTFCRLLLILFPTHLELVRKKCSKELYNHLIEVPFNVLLKHEIRTTEIYEILSQCLVDIILSLQNGPIFNRTLAFITIETVPDENQRILSEKTKFLIANFNKPNGVIDININNNNKNDQNKPKHSYYAISQNGAFYCVKNYKNEEKDQKSIENENDFLVVESSLPLGSSRYRITPSHFLTVPQKNKFSNKLKKKINNVPEKLSPLLNLSQKVCVSADSYMFSQVPSSALLFKVLSLFSQSALKFSTSLKCNNKAEVQMSQSIVESECSLLNSQNSFSAIPKPSKLLANEINSNSIGNITGSYPIPCMDEKSALRSRSMNNIALQRSEITDQITAQNVNRIFKRSQRMKQIIGVIYMEKGQILNLNADYCINKNFFDSDDTSSISPNSDDNLQNLEINNIDNDSEKNSKDGNSCSFDESENEFIDNIIEEKVSFITQVPWNETTLEFKEFVSSIGSFHLCGKPNNKKSSNIITNHDENIENQSNDIRNDLINVHYVDFHSDAIFLVGPFIGFNSYQNSAQAEGKSFSQEMYCKSCRIKNSIWKHLKKSHVLIIWNDDNTKFGINVDRNTMRVFIIISPIRNNLFKVSVIENFQQQQQQQQNSYNSQFLNSFTSSTPKFDEILKISSGPLFGDTIVPKRSLGELVRATAIYEDRKVRSLIESKEKEELYMEQITQEIEKKKKGRKFAFNYNQTFDQKKKKKKVSLNNEEIFSELWRDFPESFSFFY